MRHWLVDWQNPVNWQHPLNWGLSTWVLVTPHARGGTLVRDLARSQFGTLTNASPSTCWVNTNRNGHWGAIAHNGGTDTLAIPNGGGLNAVATGTISLWANWTSTTQEIYVSLYGAVFGRSNNVTFVNQTIALDGTNPTTAKIVWRPYVTGTSACVSTTSPGINTWHHILVTYSSGSHVLYVNGVQEATGVTTGTMTNSASVALSIGSLNSSNMIGQYDNVRVFPNRIFSAREAQEEYQLTRNWCDGLLRVRRRGFKAPATNRRRRLLLSGGAA